MDFQPTLHSRLFRDFLALAPSDYHGVIRFYEEQEAALYQMSAVEQTEVLLAYTQALFEVGAYRPFLAIADEAIMAVLDADYHLGERSQRVVFHQLLFRKAAAYLHCHQPDKTVHVAKELLRLTPNDALAMGLMRKAIRAQDDRIIRFSRPLVIALLGITALTIVVEILAIRSFYEAHTAQVEALRNLLFASALLVWGGGEGLTAWRAHRASKDYIRTKTPQSQQ